MMDEVEIATGQLQDALRLLADVEASHDVDVLLRTAQWLITDAFDELEVAHRHLVASAG